MSHGLKVALVASSLGRGGAEKQFCYIAQALVASGVDARAYHLASGGHYASVLREAGVPYFPVQRPGHRLSILAELTKQLVCFRPHIALASQFGDVSYAGVAGRVAGSIVIAGIRSSGVRDIKMFGARAPWMMRLVNSYMTNSRRACQNLMGLGIQPNRIAVLPNVIDLNSFDASPEASNPAPGRILALAVGRMHPNKRFDWFIEALALARRQVPELAGIIAGGDEGDYSRLQQQATAMGLGSDDLRFLGEHGNVPSLMRHARMLVLTSREEGFPNAILEAMSARLPVITTPAGDAPVLVQHEGTGFVAESVEDISSRMVFLATSPERARALGAAGRLLVEKQFQYPCLAPRLHTIFRNVASEHNRTRLAKVFAPRSIFHGASLYQLLNWVSRS